ncbi:MAG: hypothetical protein TEF_06655 [Rhizobiales bacterium NRL2]|jgi:hypothetical protein|nr:MAG: hypothetical protein TEF_06655 [Rhizobiales bacterium NRL2]
MAGLGPMAGLLLALSISGAVQAAEAEREVPIHLKAIYYGFKVTCDAVIEPARGQPFAPASDSIVYYIDADPRDLYLSDRFIIDYRDRHATYGEYPDFDFDQEPAAAADTVASYLEGPATGLLLMNGRDGLYDGLADELASSEGFRRLAGAAGVYEGFLIARDGIMQALVVNALDPETDFNRYVVNVFHTALIGAEIYTTYLGQELGEFRFDQPKRYLKRSAETYYFVRSLRDRLVPYAHRRHLYSEKARAKIDDERNTQSEFTKPLLPPYRLDMPESCADEFDWVSEYVSGRQE